MIEKKITKRYVTCFKCNRDFELEEDKELGLMWGTCPVCKAVYDVNLKTEQK